MFTWIIVAMECERRWRPLSAGGEGMSRFHLAQMRSNRPNRFGFLSQMAGSLIDSNLFFLRFHIGQGLLNKPNLVQ